jgi:pimeloyl-ACP methyl ester carboxylesterase
MTLRAYEIGEGSPLVVLHPGPGLDGSVMLPFFEALADAHRIIALDLHSGDPARWTLGGAADEVRETAEALGLPDYALLGHSFGGLVALHHAVRFPGHAARLVVSQSVADEACFERLTEALEAFGSPEVVAAFEREDSVLTGEDVLEVWLDQLPFFVADPEGPGRAGLADALRDVQFSVDATRHEGWGDHDVRAQLGTIAVPTLVIAGAEDRIMPRPFVAAVADGIPGAELAVVEGAGHFAFAERPAEYFGALRAWLAS